MQDECTDEEGSDEKAGKVQDEEDAFDPDEDALTVPTRSSTGISSMTDFSAFSLPSPEKEDA